MANRPRADNPHRSVRVEDDLWEAARLAAIAEGTTRAEVMQEALRELVARNSRGAEVVSSLDPRWEWITMHSLAGDEWHVKSRCNHTEVVPVEAGGEVIAHLCQTCDTQLPPEWRP